jgi:putative intracellular protease/amidase
MKRLLIAIVLCTCILSNAQSTSKVLLFMRNAQTSGDLEYMLRKEVGVMKDTLEKSGYKVVITTLDGASFSAGSTTVKADIRLTDVKVADYAGFILPCLAVPSVPEPVVSSEAIALVQGAIAAGKPVAAQTGSLWTLAKAGLLKGKKYAYAMAEQSPHFAGATFAGTGIVRDGLIITSGICPYMALKAKMNDGTEQLALALVAAMKEKRQESTPAGIQRELGGPIPLSFFIHGSRAPVCRTPSFFREGSLRIYRLGSLIDPGVRAKAGGVCHHSYWRFCHALPNDS